MARTFSIEDEAFMLRAMDLARKAYSLGEAPVGAIVTLNNEILAQAHNRIEIDSDPTAHAEILAIREAARLLGDWRLLYSTVYVTLEPCIMCACALLHARVPRIVYAAHDKNWGAFGSLFDLAHDPRLNHQIEVVSGLLEDQATKLMKQFFLSLRKKKEL